MCEDLGDFLLQPYRGMAQKTYLTKMLFSSSILPRAEQL